MDCVGKTLMDAADDASMDFVRDASLDSVGRTLDPLSVVEFASLDDAQLEDLHRA